MKNIFITVLVLACLCIRGQVGINTSSPSAALDVVSKDKTSDTNALEVNNSDILQLFKVQNNGNVGVNIGDVPATAILHMKNDIKHENLPVLQPPYSPLVTNTSGAAGGSPVITKYFYFKRSVPFSAFTLSDPNVYTNIPFTNGDDVLGNTAGFTFGTDVSGTVDGKVVNDIKYLVIPEPGVYLFEMYQTASCSNLPTTSSNTGLVMLNTVFGTAGSTGSVYTVNTVSRNYMIPRRSVSGALHSTSYSYANPQTMIAAYQSTVVNEKVALFINYAVGDQFANQTCNMNRPVGSDNYGYLIVTKL